MYPYRSRARWFLAGRYAHLVQAVHSSPYVAQDPELDHRVHALRTWNTVRFAVSILLGLGAAATVASAVAQLLPGGLDDSLVRRLVAASTALTGALTVAYVVLTRLLAQLEIDILALVTVGRQRMAEPQ